MKNNTHDSQAARRAYWTQQMDEAYDFMQRMRDYPVEECGEPLFSMRDAVVQENLEVAFADGKIAEDLDRIFFLRVGLRDGFLGAARAMNERGWILKVEDGFRSLEMQSRLSRRPRVLDAILKTTMWELGETPSPEFFLKRLSALTAIRPSVGTHMSGSAIDISVLQRDDGSEVWRDGPYLEMSELTPMASPFATPQDQENRRDIEQIMSQNGFFAYPFEFWHFNSGDGYAEFLGKTGQPARYGAVHLNQADGSVTPVEDPDQALQTPEIMQREIAASLARSCDGQQV